MPKDTQKYVTYDLFVCNIQAERKEKESTRFEIGGDRINYPGGVTIPTADMLVAKVLFNSVVSTKSVQSMTIDTSNVYLVTPLMRPEYIQINLQDIPEELI